MIKKAILIISAIIFSLNLFCQETKQFELVDTLKNRAFDVKQGAEIKVKTDDTLYKGNINDLNDNYVLIDSTKVDWKNIESIRFKDKETLNYWLKIAGITVLTNIVFSTFAYIIDGNQDGFGGLIFLLISLPLLIISALIALIGLILYKKGRTIKYKNKKHE